MEWLFIYIYFCLLKYIYGEQYCVTILRQDALKVLLTPVEVDATLSRNNLQLNYKTNQTFVLSTY